MNCMNENKRYLLGYEAIYGTERYRYLLREAVEGSEYFEVDLSHIDEETRKMIDALTFKVNNLMSVRIKDDKLKNKVYDQFFNANRRLEAIVIDVHQENQRRALVSEIE